MLSETLVTSADRLRDVLIHEMCHVATWNINKQQEDQDHGPIWQTWYV